MRVFLERLFGALKLDARVYRAVKRDSGANAQAVLIWVLSGFAAGASGAQSGGYYAFYADSITAAFGWLAWSGISYFIATRLLPEPATAEHDWRGWLRAAGFASAPGLLQAFAVLPFAGAWLRALAWVWMSLAFVIAARSAFAYASGARAVAVCALGWMLATVLSAALYFVPAW
jgi:hypothetical protein